MKRIASSRFRSVARFAAIGAILFGAAFFPTHNGLTRAAEKELSPKDRASILEDVWRNVRDRYYDPEFHGVNWDDVGNRYRPLVEGVKNDSEFYALVNRMTGELHDGHTRFNSPEAWENREKDLGVSIGFFTAEREGSVVVTDVLPESGAAHAGIEPGMLVLTVNGKPIADLIAQAEKTVLPSSTERLTRRRVLASAYTGGIGAAFQVGLQRADGTKFEASVTKQILAMPPDVRDILLPSGEAYIRFDGFKPPVVQEFYDAIEKYRNAPGVIIDLRYNGGGQTNVLAAIAGYFFDAKTVIAESLSRKAIDSQEKSGESKTHRPMTAGKPGGQIYSGPVVILTTEATASSSEIFSAAFQDTGRAKIVGSQTCGCVIGIANNQKMKGGGVLEVSEVLYFTPKGRKLEGDGVTPDTKIVPTIADLQQKRDAALTQAEQMLATMGGAKPVVAASGLQR
jgi:carboxyl-terminal processing protease|nr:S41 family peptidase [Candidatus Acidoferrales bacterium]